MTNTITVEAVGSAPVVPDAVQATLAIEYNGPDVSAVLSELAQGSAALLATVREAGVPDANIATQTMNVSSGWRGEGAPTDYQTSQTFTVRMPRMEQLGELLPRLGEVVGNALRVHGMGSIATDTGAAQAAAREAAMAGAREQAEHLAALAGCTLGRVTGIEPAGGHAMPGMRAMAASLDVGGVAMAGGERDITVALQVTWELAG